VRKEQKRTEEQRVLNYRKRDEIAEIQHGFEPIHLMAPFLADKTKVLLHENSRSHHKMQAHVPFHYDFLGIVLAIWPTWSSRSQRQNSFRKVGITQTGLDEEGISNRSFNFATPEKFKPKVAPDFSDSPDGPRKGYQEHLQFKLKWAYEHVECLKITPLRYCRHRRAC
jgi:hypothetical protein